MVVTDKYRQRLITQSKQKRYLNIHLHFKPWQRAWTLRKQAGERSNECRCFSCSASTSAPALLSPSQPQYPQCGNDTTTAPIIKSGLSNFVICSVLKFTFMVMREKWQSGKSKKFINT